MEKVQEQRLQPKTKFLLGYNKKTVVLRGLGGEGEFGGGIFPGGKRLSKACTKKI